ALAGTAIATIRIVKQTPRMGRARISAGPHYSAGGHSTLPSPSGAPGPAREGRSHDDSFTSSETYTGVRRSEERPSQRHGRAFGGGPRGRPDERGPSECLPSSAGRRNAALGEARRGPSRPPSTVQRRL